MTDNGLRNIRWGISAAGAWIAAAWCVTAGHPKWAVAFIFIGVMGC